MFIVSNFQPLALDLGSPKRKKPRKRFANPLSDPEPNPLQRASEDKDERDKAKQPVARLAYIEDILEKLKTGSTNQLVMPAKTRSLLRNRGLFVLIQVNSDPQMVQDRLSLTLYHLLYSEVICKNGNLNLA